MKTSNDAFAATATTSTHPASVCPCVRSRPIAAALALAVGLALSAWAAEPVAKEKPAAATKAAPGATPSAKSPDGWESLFDGKTLTHWKATDFGGKGEVKVAKGEISLGSGYMTGITFTNTNTLPRMNYEVELDAKRVDGGDFFCGLTFPVGKDQCSFVVGGWGGSVVGLSSLDGEDAASNETTKTMTFQNGKWYHVHVKVTPGKIQAWIDDEQMVNIKTEERRVSIRIEMEQCTPLGVATWSTAAALKDIRLRKLD